MTDPEREHFARQVHDLEHRLRRWQLVAFVLAALLLVPVVGVGLMGSVLGPRAARERAFHEELERARMEALKAELQAAQQRDEADTARQQAEEALREWDRVRQAAEEKLGGEARDKE
jgi:hypothetical protein